MCPASSTSTTAVSILYLPAGITVLTPGALPDALPDIRSHLMTNPKISQVLAALDSRGHHDVVLLEQPC